MNKIEIGLGGHRWSANDFNYVNNAFAGAIGALAFENAILKGLRMTSPTPGILDLSAGFVAINGEVYEFFGEPYYQNFTNPVLVPYQVNDTATGLSPRTYVDASIQNPHKKRAVKIEESASQPVKFAISELADYADDWHQVSDTADIVGGFKSGSVWTVYSAGSAHDQLRIRKVGRYVELIGAIQTNAFTDNSIVFTLPEVPKHNSYRPSNAHAFVVSGNDLTGSWPNNYCGLFVQQNGSVVINKGSYGGSSDLLIDINVRFKL